MKTKKYSPLKTAIIYTTTYGTTEKVANYIAEKLHYKNIDVVELKHNTDFDVSPYDIVILGASVYLGDIQLKYIPSPRELFLASRFLHDDLCRQSSLFSQALGFLP